MLTLIEITDFDILAHLTCPLRYINGKYKIGIELSRYDKKIEKILHQIIQKGIALEVNTSSFALLHNFMPSADILQKYYDMGGALLTLGSGAHVKEDASKNFDEAIHAIKEIGYDKICTIKKESK